MNKIIALFLLLALAVTTVPFVATAEDTAAQAEEQPDVIETTIALGPHVGDWTVDNNTYKVEGSLPKDDQQLYVLGNATDGEATISSTINSSRDRIGYMFGITNSVNSSTNNNKAEVVKRDSYYLIWFRGDQDRKVQIYRIESENEQKKEEIQSGVTADTFKLSATYKKTGGKVEISISIDGKPLVTYTDDKPFDGMGYGLATRAQNGDRVWTDVQYSGQGAALTDNELASLKAKEDSKLTYVKGSGSTYNLKNSNGNTEVYGANFNPDNLFGVGTEPRFFAQSKGEGGSTLSTITWEMAEGIPAYFVINTHTGSTSGRYAKWFKLYASNTNDDSSWDLIAASFNIGLDKDNATLGIKTTADKAYRYYKFEFVPATGGFYQVASFELYTDSGEQTLSHSDNSANCTFFYQVSNTNGSNYRIIGLIKEGYVPTCKGVTITFTNADGQTRSKTFGIDDTLTVYETIEGTSGGKTVTYKACSGSYIFGWVITGVEDGYFPTAAVVVE